MRVTLVIDVIIDRSAVVKIPFLYVDHGQIGLTKSLQCMIVLPVCPGKQVRDRRKIKENGR
jgi:hypothetical protein